MELHAAGPTGFAFSEATDLAAALRRAAGELEAQATSRRSWATAALVEWRGRFAEEFRRDTEVGAANGLQFATALRAAAVQLDQLAVEAREEQRRRDAAAAWKREQDSESAAEKLFEKVFDRDEKPPWAGATKAGRTCAPEAPLSAVRF